MTLGRTVHAEICKLVTSKATLLVCIGGIIIPAMLAMATGFASANRHVAIQAAVQDRGSAVAGFGQPLVILLAALTVSSEYSDGQIRMSLAATPNRLRLVAAKAIVVAVTSAVIGLTATPISAILEQWSSSWQTDQGVTLVFTIPMLINVLGVALNYMMISLLALGLTIITRSSIATLVVMIPMVLGLTIGLISVFPVLKYLPDLAGIQLLTRYPGVPLLAPIPGALVMAAWTGLLLVAAAILFIHSDVGH